MSVRTLSWKVLENTLPNRECVSVAVCVHAEAGTCKIPLNNQTNKTVSRGTTGCSPLAWESRVASPNRGAHGDCLR